MNNKSTPQKFSRLQIWLLMLLVVVIGGGFFVSAMYFHRLNASAAFYIGLPALIAVLIIMTNPSDNPIGATMKGITLMLVLSVPLLQEGFICVLIAAPLFYAVGAAVAYLYVQIRNKNKDSTLQSSALLIMLVASMEGMHEDLTVERFNLVEVEKVIAAPAHAVAAQLQQPVQLQNKSLSLLSLFPFPEIEHEGDTQRMHFVYNKHIWFNAVVGDVNVQVTERGDNFIHSEVVSDNSYLKNYMDWKTSRVEWQAIDANHTKVKWSIGYDRKLDPAWYFGPIEAYTVELVADMLIDNAATPAGVVAGSSGS